MFFSDQYVKGILSSTRTWTKADSPYIITDDIIIIDGVTLTIEAGVTLKFYKDKFLKVFGEIIAIGTQNEPIIFTAAEDNPANSFWSGVMFEESSKPAVIDKNGKYLSGSAFIYCIFEWAGSNASSIIEARAGYSGYFISNCTIRKINITYNSEFWAIYNSLPVLNCIIKEVRGGEGLYKSEKFTGIYTSGKAIGNEVFFIQGFSQVYGIRTSKDAIHNKVGHIMDCGEVYGIYARGDAISNFVLPTSKCYTVYGIYCEGKADSNDVRDIDGLNVCGISTYSSAAKNVIKNIGGSFRHYDANHRFLYARGQVSYNIISNFAGLANDYAERNPIGIQVENNDVFCNEVQRVAIGISSYSDGSETVSIVGNVIKGCNIGITNRNKSEIIYNTMTNNKIGLEFGGGIVKNNAIFNNHNFNFYLNISEDTDVSNNYWGLTNDDDLYNLIYDYYKGGSGKVTFRPFLLEQPKDEEIMEYLKKKWLQNN